MLLRPYTPADLDELLTLFYETVHTVNARDYTPPQLDAWAPREVDRARWDSTLQAHTSLVAVEAGQIIGFGDIDTTGYLNRLYVHKDHQRQGVATALCDSLEAAVTAPVLTTHASITARPFFIRRGCTVVRAQQVERFGVVMTNYVMKKQR